MEPLTVECLRGMLGSLKKMCKQKLLPGGIRQKKARMIFSKLKFSEPYISDLDSDLQTLECFWNLAKRIGDKFELRITYPDTEDNAEQSGIEAAALKTIFNDMRVYQARRQAAGQKLRVSKKEMLSWIDDDPWKFVVNFPDPSEVINTGDEGQNIS
ncbi:hypothetical protein D6D01_08554 [Aureobasidium pullulans]|uniref:Uncharacterized protein n=1 Tax=Aureobasidium pullulans TaxID=5580 RepID=A0A4S9K9Y9_AURPU|nr:hypothetical protein D6D01_08554 [Aureobasidium pullulans]